MMRMGFDEPSPLFKAIQNNEVSKVKSILSRSKKAATTMDDNGCLPLQLAVSRKRKEIVVLLLAAGASPLQDDEHGISAFDIAHKAKDKEMVAILSGSAK